MQKSFKLAALVGALSMAMGSSAMATNHDLVFGGWTVSAGVIDETGAGSVCSNAAYDCATIASGLGFKQLQVSAAAGTPGAVAGDSYIMTIVTDQLANTSDANSFSDVSFVKMKLNVGGTTDSSNVNENGIHAQQTIKEAGGTGGSTTVFDSTTDINTGWSVSGTPIVISQSLSDAGPDTTIRGDDFDSSFNYASQNDTTVGSTTYGQRTGFTLDIDQTAGLFSPKSPESKDDTQVFALRERQGTMSEIAGDVTLGSGTTSWVAGDDVKAIWLGQTINLDSAGTPGSANSLGSAFGYLSFQNVGSGAPTTSEFGFGATNAAGAWGWDAGSDVEATFGSATTLGLTP
jgi:hypothetical protein